MASERSKNSNYMVVNERERKIKKSHFNTVPERDTGTAVVDPDPDLVGYETLNRIRKKHFGSRSSGSERHVE
jgi:hypothetical protein